MSVDSIPADNFRQLLLLTVASTAAMRSVPLPRKLAQQRITEYIWIALAILPFNICIAELRCNGSDMIDAIDDCGAGIEQQSAARCKPVHGNAGVRPL